MNISGIEIIVTKKAIKNLHLYIKPPNGEVIVSAPLFYKDENIEAFVKLKLNWIRKSIEKMKNYPRQTVREYVSGESIYLWGNRYLLKVKEGTRYDVKIAGTNIYFTVRKGATVSQKTKKFNEFYKKVLVEKINERQPVLENKCGLYASDYKVQDMKSRWGVCHINDKKITLNLQLVKRPLICLDYVMIHELSHLKYKNHGVRFKKLLDKYMPNWREVKKLLNE